ncbi:Protoporphyrinogen IX oxidase, menaquinone-dependent (flavodoxin domain) [Pelagirhabdus alkalitolerans]|uniref:Protoporphyrinogen IX oxidase, menaquinone-dependent (Flavodoxin domain) n=1 Tax=Pelagirhabdus alkalitolerans TaxID=1612202 RepID=A0A1G6GIN5_9BACI|nr:flavodoxin domain-containing protein [Pelagirhabdus alkalitolerans]SDB81867.1 Protoporphyrinogen IX oxidase, menaquinone-dependent (flavodoxin domain) [Pelagirhabdus alkalitolerans]
MQSILIIYQSKTGFTKKYVDWLTKSISCHVVRFEEINSVSINDYDIVIYGAGLHAGRIKGIKAFKQEVLNTANKQFIVLVTGGTPFHEELILNIKNNNFSEDELNNIKLFYCQSGLNYKKMGMFDKLIMKSFSKLLELKKDKSEIESGTSQAISGSYDHSNQKYLNPLIEYIDQLIDD